MKITPKAVAGISIPPAAAITTGTVLLTKGNTSSVEENPDNNAQNVEPRAQEDNKQQVQVVIPSPRPQPPLLPIAPIKASEESPTEPTYSESVYSDSIFVSDSSKLENNVIRHNSSNFLLNADPAFSSDSIFQREWGKKLDYLKTKETTNIVSGSVFKRALSSISELTRLCREAYTGSNRTFATSTKIYWGYPNSSYDSMYQKTGQGLETYWNAVWNFCTKTNLNERNLIKVPQDWGGIEKKIN